MIGETNIERKIRKHRKGKEAEERKKIMKTIKREKVRGYEKRKMFEDTDTL